MSETDLVQAILVELSKRDCLVWYNASGSLPDAHGRWVRFGLEGSPDVLGFCRGWTTPGGAICGPPVRHPCGHMLAFEVKTPAGRLRPAQLAWGHQASEAGVCYGVVRSVADALALLEGHQRTHRRRSGPPPDLP